MRDSTEVVYYVNHEDDMQHPILTGAVINISDWYRCDVVKVKIIRVIDNYMGIPNLQKLYCQATEYDWLNIEEDEVTGEKYYTIVSHSWSV